MEKQLVQRRASAHGASPNASSPMLHHLSSSSKGRLRMSLPSMTARGAVVNRLSDRRWLCWEVERSRVSPAMVHAQPSAFAGKICKHI